MQSPSDYILEDFSIISAKLNSPLSITGLIGELAIFESLALPYLTGKVLIRDDARLYDGIEINGTETCRISLKCSMENSKTITKYFNFHSVASTTKTSDTVEILSLQLIETNAFNNSAISVNKAYKGTADAIIKKILADHLFIDNDDNTRSISGIAGPAVKPYQEPFKCIIANKTPFAACKWIMNKMTTSMGLPYYLYSTLNGDNLQLRSFEEMLTSKPWNSDNPYRYNIAHAQSPGHNQENMIFNVMQYAIADKENVVKLLNTGSIGSETNVTDITSGQQIKFHHDVDRTLVDLIEANIINSSENPIHHSFYRVASNDKISEMNNYSISKIIGNNTYNGIRNYHEENNSGALKLYAMQKAINNLMFKSSINFSVHGLPYLPYENASLGRKIRFEYTATDQFGPQVDKKRSGDYVIYSARHLFADKRHTVDMTAVKLGSTK